CREPLVVFSSGVVPRDSAAADFDAVCAPPAGTALAWFPVLAGCMKSPATPPIDARRLVTAAAVLAGALLLTARPAAALDRLCDPAFENCRTQLLDLINRETQGIDVAFWFMEDTRYLTAITERWRAGVPMRQRIASGILHWKMMLFVGQGVVEFSGANYSVDAFKPVTAYSNYVDESVFFTDDAAIVQTFMTRFDSSWIDRT